MFGGAIRSNIYTIYSKPILSTIYSKPILSYSLTNMIVGLWVSVSWADWFSLLSSIAICGCAVLNTLFMTSMLFYPEIKNETEVVSGTGTLGTSEGEDSTWSLVASKKKKIIPTENRDTENVKDSFLKLTTLKTIRPNLT